jgi:hypothetical protein
MLLPALNNAPPSTALRVREGQVGRQRLQTLELGSWFSEPVVFENAVGDCDGGGEGAVYCAAAGCAIRQKAAVDEGGAERDVMRHLIVIRVAGAREQSRKLKLKCGV